MPVLHPPYQVKDGVECLQLLAVCEGAAGVVAGGFDRVPAARSDGHHQEQAQGHRQEGGREVVDHSPPAQGSSHLERREGLMVRGEGLMERGGADASNTPHS